ncbi:exodeoxyribonuclease V subunit beta [Neisseria animaloris]|uniref:exodeoxyribonuclease V subunit beta n=1 Tax=Neisseria animaloris TaxID=326522 RepID=UPI000A19832F|nr:exodeoxyribonuclease V subunit beta [Neisseria animaloris]OSI08206.1 exodeoxyribonuclease V subunit beta [Neisseria animaloris]VEH86582.1 exodeoxyribonuclease V subunit beta [Neisseria animaloris]
MPTRHQPFNPLTIPIQGTNLIEASAGTGKTYGIAALFTRLVVLEKMPVESILVVTFTKAATAELKTRLRARLDDVLRALEENPNAAHDSDGLQTYCEREHKDDGFILPLLTQALSQEPQARLIVRLKAAIGQFDNAAIYTIHGFCQRLLRDYAFLCQVPFDVELAEDNRERLLVPAEDFWRANVSDNPLLARLVFKYKQTPQTVLAKIKKFISRPYLVFRRPQADLAGATATLQQTWQKVRENLTALTETFWRVHPNLNGNSYRKTSFENLFAELRHAAEYDLLPAFNEKLAMFAADVLESKTKKHAAPDLAAYADLQMLANLGRDLAAVGEEEQNALTTLQLDLLEHINNALAEQKKSRHERSFDDLLLDVHHALTQSPHRRTLAETVADNWKVALIDEFQDTDPLQYEIFSRLFIRQGNPLFLVGDPKQAIYSFRGADIYAYLQAAEDAEHHYTLATNYRSHAKLINGIGALFKQKNRPFVLEHINYTDVAASRKAGRLKPARPAIQVRWLNRNDDDSTAKEKLRRRAAEYCADEIAQALNEAAAGRLNYQKNADSEARPLQSGQIAVLVRTHNEGLLISQELKKRNVQSVIRSRESVFTTPEAEAVAALLGFWLQPQQTESLRFVLGSILFQQTAAELYTLNNDENALLAWIASAETAAATWRQHGIYAAMQQFAARHGIETRLLKSGNERSLTNYHQILEHLAEEDEQSHTPSSLHQWLLEQIQAAQESGGSENNILRLESDDALVKIVTMHAAKGLQYPLVYCPFVWDAADNKPAEWQILHQNRQAILLAKHQLDNTDTELLADEELAERLRLLYVALTRAEEQLNIYAAYCNDTADNTFAYLLEGGQKATRAENKVVYKAAKNEEGMAMLKANWRRFIDDVSENTEFVFTEDAPPQTIYHSMQFSDGLYQAASIPERAFELIRHTSFTGLSRHTRSRDSERDELQPAIDPAESSIVRPSEKMPSENSQTDGIHAFPRGTNAGVCLHEILEHFDFAASATAQTKAVSAALARYGFDDTWLPVVNAMLEHVRQTPLTGKYALADIAADRCLPEMAFTLYMHDFNLNRLREWFARPHLNLPSECVAAAQQLDFAAVKGFLNGFIDMVYQDSDGLVCVIDYKSNRLGDTATDYTQTAMNEAMAEHHYYLQALIYAVAVARYFKIRGLPQPQIAVRYLFLRGLDGSGNGIWAWNLDSSDLAEWL